jgi:hypothetical protein
MNAEEFRRRVDDLIEAGQDLGERPNINLRVKVERLRDDLIKDVEAALQGAYDQGTLDGLLQPNTNWASEESGVQIEGS